MLVIALSTSVEMFLVAIALAGLGNGLYLGVDYALIADVLPDSGAEAGKGMGVFNLSSTSRRPSLPCSPPRSC